MRDRRRVALVALCALVASLPACDGGTGADGARDDNATDATTAPTAPTTVLPQASPLSAVALPTNDGSLGDANSKQACALLTSSDIESHFGGPVGKATPIYPYCQWVVGDDAFIAVTIFSSPIDEVRQVNEVRRTVTGIGDDAFIASTRALFFGKNGFTYSILWQKVSDYTSIETDGLQALALALLGRVG